MSTAITPTPRDALLAQVAERCAGVNFCDRPHDYPRTPYTAAIGGLDKALRVLRDDPDLYTRTRLDYDSPLHDVMVTSIGEAQLRCTRHGSPPWARWSAEVRVPGSERPSSTSTYSYIDGLDHRSLHQAVRTAARGLRRQLSQELLRTADPRGNAMSNYGYDYETVNALAELPPLQARLLGFADDAGMHCAWLAVTTSDPDGRIEVYLSSGNDPKLSRDAVEQPTETLRVSLAATADRHAQRARDGRVAPIVDPLPPTDPSPRDVAEELRVYSPILGDDLAAWSPPTEPGAHYRVGHRDDPCARYHGDGSVALLRRLGPQLLEASLRYSAHTEPRLHAALHGLEALAPQSLPEAELEL